MDEKQFKIKSAYETDVEMSELVNEYLVKEVKFINENRHSAVVNGVIDLKHATRQKQIAETIQYTANHFKNKAEYYKTQIKELEKENDN